jgi:protein-tyrosine-phosphatase
MAEAFLNHLAKDKAIAGSAGTEPVQRVNPMVVEAMLEVGIDISSYKSKMLTLEMLENADLVITMGCSVAKACPATFVTTEDWELDDPEGSPLEKVRQIRDEIRNKVEALIEVL